MNILEKEIIEFELPATLACALPTEERGMQRDEVRLLVTTGEGQVAHSQFSELDRFLLPEDVLVVNTSATIPAALPVNLPGGKPGMVHFCNRINSRDWLIEIREIVDAKTIRWKGGVPGMKISLPARAGLALKERFYDQKQWLDLWITAFYANQPISEYLTAQAQPIQYENLDRNYPMEYYQTYFSFHPGSSEMPSAGRAFTGRLVENILRKGVTIVPILLHTGISSLEENEQPYAEYMEIDPLTASTINAALQQNRRIIAVGTTVVRALESAVDSQGNVMHFKGNTDLFIEEDSQLKVVDGLITGFHEPRASHLKMLQAVAGTEHLDQAYTIAIDNGYYWHQFGDLHLILSGNRKSF